MLSTILLMVLFSISCSYWGKPTPGRWRSDTGDIKFIVSEDGTKLTGIGNEMATGASISWDYDTHYSTDDFPIIFGNFSVFEVKGIFDSVSSAHGTYETDDGKVSWEASPFIEPINGAITGHCYSDGLPLSGYTVYITGPNSYSSFGSSSYFSFTNLISGQYTVTINWPNETSSNTLLSLESNELIDLSLNATFGTGAPNWTESSSKWITF